MFGAATAGAAPASAAAQHHSARETTDLNERARRTLRTALAIAVLWLALPVAIVELGLRAIERLLWTEEHAIASGDDVYPLDDLGDVEDPVAAAAADDELRILSLGDSFAQSIVEPPGTYARHLERELGARVAHGVRVINLGRGGTSFPGYLHELDTWQPRLEPDAVRITLSATG